MPRLLGVRSKNRFPRSVTSVAVLWSVVTVAAYLTRSSAWQGKPLLMLSGFPLGLVAISSLFLFLSAIVTLLFVPRFRWSVLRVTAAILFIAFSAIAAMNEQGNLFWYQRVSPPKTAAYANHHTFVQALCAGGGVRVNVGYSWLRTPQAEFCNAGWVRLGRYEYPNYRFLNGPLYGRAGFYFGSWHGSQYVIVFPQWLPLVAVFIAVVIVVRRDLRFWLRTRRGHCLQCGYDLRVATSVCPECGSAVASEVVAG
jgi:hypothetical protein